MSHDLLRKLGLRIREIRTQHGMTQQQLAERVGFRSSYFSHIENGAKGTTLETLAAIAAALGMTLSELVLGIDQPIPQDFDRLSIALAGQSVERQRILLGILEGALRLAAER
jgi:transcriptional regulator with XRE-family HTH domain